MVSVEIGNTNLLSQLYADMQPMKDSNEEPRRSVAQWVKSQWRTNVIGTGADSDFGSYVGEKGGAGDATTIEQTIEDFHKTSRDKLGEATHLWGNDLLKPDGEIDREAINKKVAGGVEWMFDKVIHLIGAGLAALLGWFGFKPAAPPPADPFSAYLTAHHLDPEKVFPILFVALIFAASWVGLEFIRLGRRVRRRLGKL